MLVFAIARVLPGDPVQLAAGPAQDPEPIVDGWSTSADAAPIAGWASKVAAAAQLPAAYELAAGKYHDLALADRILELSAATLAAVWKVFAPATQLFATSSRPQVWLTLETRRVWQVEKGRISEL